LNGAKKKISTGTKKKGGGHSGNLLAKVKNLNRNRPARTEGNEITDERGKGPQTHKGQPKTWHWERKSGRIRKV